MHRRTTPSDRNRTNRRRRRWRMTKNKDMQTTDQGLMETEALEQVNGGRYPGELSDELQ